MSASEQQQINGQLADLSPDDVQGIVLTLDLDDSPTDRSILTRLLRILAENHLTEALEIASTLPDRNCQVIGLQLGKSFAAADPTGAAHWVQGADWNNPNVRWLALALAPHIAQIDPGAALELLQSSDEARRKFMAPQLLQELAKSDFDTAWRTLRAFPPGDQDDLAYRIFNGLAATDAKRAYTELTNRESARLTEKVLPSLLSQWLRQDASGAAGILHDLPTNQVQAVFLERNAAGELAITGFLATDRSATLAALDKLAPTASNRPIFETTAKLLGQSDLETTLTWISTFQESELKETLKARAIEANIAEDPGTMGPRILSNPGIPRSAAIEAVAKAWGEQDALSALDYSRALSGDDQAQFVARVIESSLPRAPEIAMDFILHSADNPMMCQHPSYQGAVYRAALKYAQEDRERALAWTDSLPSSLRASATAAVAEEWIKLDPRAASEWMQGLSPGPIRDAAVTPMIRELEGTDPEMAARWEATLSKQE